MKWELLGKETVIIDGVKFHVGAKWLPAIKEKSGFSRKLKINNQLITSGTTTGCIIEWKDSAQIVNCSEEQLNLPLLAPAFFGDTNTLYFAKVSEELYWVVSYDNAGCIDIASDSDSVKELYPLRDYIREVMDLSEVSETFKIINIGDRVFLDDQHIDARVEHRPLDEGHLKKLQDSKYKVKRQAGNLKKKIYLTGILSVGTIGALVYALITSMPEEIINIQDGEHSRVFTSEYNKIKKAYNEITTIEKKKSRMSDEKVLLMGKEEFNDYILSRGLSNDDVVKESLRIRSLTPLMIKGWVKESVKYRNDKFLVTYVRKGEFPLSSSYKVLDQSLISLLQKRFGVSASPVSLNERATKRVYDVLVERNQQKDYSSYLDSKRESVNQKSRALARLRQTQQELDSAKRELEGVEDSVNFLGVFDRRDEVVINQIINRIGQVQDGARPTLKRMSAAIDEYNAIKTIVPPEHSDRLLGEMGIETNLVPVFQSTSKYSWASPAQTHSFPSGISDDKFKDKKVILGSLIELKFKGGVFNIWAAKPVFELPYVFVDGVDLMEKPEGKADAVIKISINELNQDYIL